MVDPVSSLNEEPFTDMFSSPGVEPRNQPPLKKCLNTKESIQVTMHQESMALGGMEAPHLTAGEEARGRNKSLMFGRLSGKWVGRESKHKGCPLSPRGRAGPRTPLLGSHCFLMNFERFPHELDRPALRDAHSSVPGGLFRVHHQTRVCLGPMLVSWHR